MFRIGRIKSHPNQLVASGDAITLGAIEIVEGLVRICSFGFFAADWTLQYITWVLTRDEQEPPTDTG